MLNLLQLTVFAAMLFQNLPWNNHGRAQNPDQPANVTTGPAPRRDLTGIWDPGRNGVNGGGFTSPPLTAWGEEIGKTHKSGDGVRMVPLPEINDPLSILGDPAGFPRLLLFEFCPVQIV